MPLGLGLSSQLVQTTDAQAGLITMYEYDLHILLGALTCCKQTKYPAATLHTDSISHLDGPWDCCQPQDVREARSWFEVVDHATESETSLDMNVQPQDCCN
jgi:hypothetical protein